MNHCEHFVPKKVPDLFWTAPLPSQLTACNFYPILAVRSDSFWIWACHLFAANLGVSPWMVLSQASQFKLVGVLDGP